VLEDIDIFATKEKQVLIYTLLDFMHRKDQLLVVIGTTTRAHLPTLLEKRTASRLNAQFVYVFCYTIVLPFFLVCGSLCLSLHLLLHVCILRHHTTRV
jgi:hypothetical protein